MKIKYAFLSLVALAAFSLVSANAAFACPCKEGACSKEHSCSGGEQCKEHNCKKDGESCAHHKSDKSPEKDSAKKSEQKSQAPSHAG